MSNSLEKLRPSGHRKELISLFLILTITVSSLVYFAYQENVGSISYSPDSPIIYIEVSGEITNSSQQCFLKISPVSSEFALKTWANHYLTADIRRRDSDGGFSFELYQWEALFQIRNDDDWLLLPSGNNLDALRTKMAFDFFNMLNEDNSNYQLPQSKLVEVYINEHYQGVYLLCERVDRKLLDLDIENTDNLENNDLIFKTSNWDGDFYTMPNEVDIIWEQIYPNTIDFSQIPKDLVNYILNASEEEIFNENNGIFKIFDKSRLIDNILFGLLVGHEVIEGSSYYLIYNHENEAEFSFLPWDFAQSWGFGEYDTIPEDLWLNEDEKEIESVVWSNLYYQLLFPNNASINDEFIAEIINRWAYIRSNLLEADDLITYFDDLYTPIQDSLIRSTNSQDFVMSAVNRIKNWINTRFNLLDDIFTENDTIFSDNFEPPFHYPEEDEVFGFSDSAARRHFYKSSRIFSKNKIHDVNITIREDFLDDIINRKYDNLPATNRLWMPSHVSLDGYSMNNVGFRMKADRGSLATPKSSFKLKFSEEALYIGDNNYEFHAENVDRRFLGLRRLNLRAAPRDPSLLNEPVGHEIFKITGNPYLRISWARLFITLTDENGNVVKSQEYKGLYWLTEDIDKTYLQSRFKNPNGNLYKTTDVYAFLSNYNLPDPKNLTRDDRRVFELRTNEEEDDYSDLTNFIIKINYDWENIEDTTNLSILAKYFAASHFQGNWDDYVVISHNFYMYSEPNAGFIMIPWDIEMNLNISPNLGNYCNAPLLDGYKEFAHWEAYAKLSKYPRERPLWDNAIKDLRFNNSFLNEMEKIANNTQNLITQVEEWCNLINLTLQSTYNHTSLLDTYMYNQVYRDNEPYSKVISYSNYIYHKTRVIDFLINRKQFVEDQLP